MLPYDFLNSRKSFPKELLAQREWMVEYLWQNRESFSQEETLSWKAKTFEITKLLLEERAGHPIDWP